MEYKVCKKCGVKKPIDDFYECKSSRDGHLGKCKECTKRDVVNYRKKNPVAVLNTRIKTCAKNPTHSNANRVVAAAIEAGKLKTPNECQGCGRKASDTRLSAHHHDYKKPLDVIWLCAACHRPIDHTRAVVESGVTWNEYRHQVNSKNAFVKRAIKYYVEHVKTRNPIFDYEKFLEDDQNL